MSDIVIYGIHSERLNRDLFTFLGAASCAYTRYFKAALQTIRQHEADSNSPSTLGPCVIVLHETKHSIPLTNSTYYYSLKLTVISNSEFHYE